MLAGIVKRFPDLEVTVLVRAASEEFTSVFPKVKAAIGDFDSFDVIQNAVQNADIIIRAQPLSDSSAP